MTTVVRLPLRPSPPPTTFLKPSFSITPTAHGTLAVSVRAARATAPAQVSERASSFEPARGKLTRLPSA